MPRERRAASRDPQRRDERSHGEKDRDKVTYLDNGGGKADAADREGEKGREKKTLMKWERGREGGVQGDGGRGGGGGGGGN